jgi:hypothetical protein
MKKLILALLALFAIQAPANAAVTIAANDNGKIFTVNYIGKVKGSTTTLLGGTQTFTFVNSTLGGTVFHFTYSLSNTSINAARLRAFGFNVVSATNPNGVSQGGVFAAGSLGANFPEGLQNRDVCVFAVSKQGNCTGGPGGLNSGQTGTGSFSLTFATGQSSITLDDFALRFASIEPEINGGDSGVGIPGVVPEPATWGLMLFGFAMIGGAMRQRRKARAAAA